MKNSKKWMKKLDRYKKVYYTAHHSVVLYVSVKDG